MECTDIIRQYSKTDCTSRIGNRRLLHRLHRDRWWESGPTRSTVAATDMERDMFPYTPILRTTTFDSFQNRWEEYPRGRNVHTVVPIRLADGHNLLDGQKRLSRNKFRKFHADGASPVKESEYRAIPHRQTMPAFGWFRSNRPWGRTGWCSGITTCRKHKGCITKNPITREGDSKPKKSERGLLCVEKLQVARLTVAARKLSCSFASTLEQQGTADRNQWDD